MSDDKQVRVREHTFDGIQEFDNRLPNWWLWTLYGAIIFSVIYWLLFHTLGVLPHPGDRFASDMQAAEAARLARASEGGVTDESLMLMAAMEDQVAEGRKHFVSHCTVCHSSQGQGLVGPNLTDRYWIHGGSPIAIHETITKGVPSKGMAAWGGQLGPRRVEQTVAYVLSIRNTEIPGKDPQGALYAPAEEAGPTKASISEEAPAESASVLGEPPAPNEDQETLEEAK